MIDCAVRFLYIIYGNTESDYVCQLFNGYIYFIIK